HTSLSGACDAQIAIEHSEDDNTVTTTVEFMKDGEAGAVVGSEIEVVEVGINDEGDPITSCIIVPAATAAKEAAKKLSPTALAGLHALKDCLADMGKVPPASNHIPNGVPCVTLKDWREYLFKYNLINREGSYREQFRRLHVTLRNAAKIGIW